jgi:hypothetical protein
LISLIVQDAASAATPDGDPPRQFQIDEGRVTNAFYQQESIAAHLLLTAGREPRVLVAFPAGNSGVGVWFEKSEKPVQWKLRDVAATSRLDNQRRSLRGIVAHASVDGPLVIRDAVLSSVRVLRDYQLTRAYPAEVKSSANIATNRIEWSRNRLDGAAGYALSIMVEDGVVKSEDGHIILSPSRSSEAMRLTFTALTGETPLTPIPDDHLLNASAGHDARSGNVLRFLAYQEKFLAGSWRFNTYFGRDTLMSLRLLMPVLQPEAIECGLMSVLQRLAPNGEVAHEEDIGEFAVLRHRKQGEAANDNPIYDYKMIDDDFMLAPIVAAYLIEHPAGRQRAAAFLNTKLRDGEQVGFALARNFAWGTRSAQAFADRPEASNLIALKPGIQVGDWRDSEDGLGGGRYPFDVNAVLVPAAMSAIASVYKSGVLQPFLSQEQSAVVAKASAIASVWSQHAPALFRVTVSNEEARHQVAKYASSIGVDAQPALAALSARDAVVNAIALDAQFKPIPILNSDVGFALLLTNPPATAVAEFVESTSRPFPAGLFTDAGLLVANPVFANEPNQRIFNRNAYHGTVVWSWQQAMMAAGLDRQLARNDLPIATLKLLRSARQRLWNAIENTRAMRSSELWSWRFANGRYEPVPFGQSSGDADESNAAQLWSTVYLALPTPSP